MPFIAEIVYFINSALKAGSLKKAKLQPAKLYGLSTQVARSSKGSKEQGKLEILPAIMLDGGKALLMAPESKIALQVYHKLIGKTYSYDKKSHGDGYNIKSTCDMNMVVFTNSKLTGRTKESLEPIVLFGLPQRVTAAFLAELQVINCLITPVSANMDQAAVYRQEYPQSDYTLNENVSMFLIRYKIELLFSQKCAEKCFCEEDLEGLRPILTEYESVIVME